MAITRLNSKSQYDRYKKHEGEQYTGMKIGGTHKWYYDQGEWRERKITPDDWQIYYKTPKRRAGHAPDESGVPVGTEYNWLIVAHQRVTKLDANTYMTCMEGRKFKVAHKRASKDTWNASEKAQRRKVIAYLEHLINELKAADEDAMVPWTVGEKERVYGLELRSVNDLKDMAGELHIQGRSKMKRDELLAAIKDKLYGSQVKKADVTSINQLIRDERLKVMKKAA
jgi:hypothetical protein